MTPKPKILHKQEEKRKTERERRLQGKKKKKKRRKGRDRGSGKRKEKIRKRKTTDCRLIFFMNTDAKILNKMLANSIISKMTNIA